MKIVAIVQARMGSTRLPNKVMKKIGGVPLIELLLARLSRSNEIHQIVVATSKDKKNDPLVEHVKKLGYFCYRGSENNVLQRYLDAAKKVSADVVVRVTGDCPLIDHEVVDQVVSHFRKLKVDYVSNISPPTYPDGLDTEVFTLAALSRASRESTSKHEHEHVTPYLRRPGFFETKNVSNSEDFSSLRWTVDEHEDFQVISNVFSYF